MPGESFRFIHASDFHLERPLGDLDTLPKHLRDAMAVAPRKAVEAIFDAAVADHIDFVVLSGDLIHPLAAGPHGMALLLDGFEMLAEKNTPVFWAAVIADDPQKWPEAAPLPPNVTLFPKNRAISVPVQRAGRTICMVVGRSSEGRQALHVPSYRVDPTDEYTVAVGYGATDAAALSEGRFDYWALGGKHDRNDLGDGDDHSAVYCGTPQGRSLDESGAHGYTVVDVDSDGTTRRHDVDCDTFRYGHVTIDAAEVAGVGSLRNLLGEKIGRLQHENGGRHLLIGWDIEVSSGDHLHSIGDPEAILKTVRQDHGHGNPSAWTIRLTVRPPRQYPKGWHDEDTILGDFLRAAENHRKADARELNLLPFTEEHVCSDATTGSGRSGLPSTATGLLTDIASSSRSEVLDQATLLGVELLRGGKPNWVRKP